MSIKIDNEKVVKRRLTHTRYTRDSNGYEFHHDLGKNVKENIQKVKHVNCDYHQKKNIDSLVENEEQ